MGVDRSSIRKYSGLVLFITLFLVQLEWTGVVAFSSCGCGCGTRWTARDWRVAKEWGVDGEGILSWFTQHVCLRPQMDDRLEEDVRRNCNCPAACFSSSLGYCRLPQWRKERCWKRQARVIHRSIP
ncbi:hypothetical protein B0T14DRAFT_259414 [Immersiella caudata]|uniref:Secreted protein n=1 Tax=Immersiella caudata TaxID=314043 RepID=A0AA40BXF0_9PEZI|nr:hypothetical protein B0T14DRAFT_259414 [Immersiella caudata]